MPNRIGPGSRHIAAFLTNEQRNLRNTASKRDIERANDQALQAAIRASQQHAMASEHLDGLTQEQRVAQETGNRKYIDEANDAALALGLQRSLDPANDVPRAARHFIPDDEFLVQRGLIEELKRWLTGQGFSIRKNNGDSNNCLIISMLQHATGDYQQNHEEAARKYKAMLVNWSGGKETSSSALFADDELARKLVEAINRDYFGTRTERYLRFEFMTADLDGRPAVRTFGDGTRAAAILDGGGHYEACLYPHQA